MGDGGDVSGAVELQAVKTTLERKKIRTSRVMNGALRGFIV